MKTIISKTRECIAESQVLINVPRGVEAQEAIALEKGNRFFKSFVQNDLIQYEQELFPAFDLHIGELHPAIGKRLQQMKLSELRHMERQAQ